MYATWPMVFAALIAGALGGLIIPDRPQPSAAPAPAKAPSAAKEAPATQSDTAQPRKIALTRESRSAGKDDGDMTRATENAAAGSCLTDEWPYRVANCLDRTASVDDPHTTVKAKRIEPVEAIRDVSPEVAKVSDEDTATRRKKQAEAKASAEEQATQRPARTETPTAREQPRRQAREPQRAEQQRFRQSPPSADRVYVRGPDGRLYLAPEPRYYVEPGYRYAPPPPGYRW